LPLVTIEELKETVEKICGKPEKAAFDERVVAAIKWVDGTVIDAVHKVKK
jgi:citrate lyase subunit alpha/citrate CoA-transferase